MELNRIKPSIHLKQDVDELNIELHQDDKNHTFPSRICVLADSVTPLSLC